MLEVHGTTAGGERAALQAIERRLRADDPALAAALASFEVGGLRRGAARSLLHAALLGAGSAFAVLGQLSSTYAVLQRSLPEALHAIG